VNKKQRMKIRYNIETLALLISHTYNNTVKIELRSSETFDPLWSLPLDFTRIFGRVNRICFLKCDEWLVIDHNTSHLFHVSKDGELKVTHEYHLTPHNAVLFGSNILSIRTTECINFYRV